MKKLWLAFVLLFSLHGLYAQTTSSYLNLTNTEGQTLKVKGTDAGLDIEGMKGKVVLLEFFGHRCPPCLATIPHLIQLQKEFKEKLTILAIEVQGLQDERLKQFIQRKGINYFTASYPKGKGIVDYVGARAQWGGGIPFTILLDKKGDVQLMQAGMIPAQQLKQIVSELAALPMTPAKAVETAETNSTVKK